MKNMDNSKSLIEDIQKKRREKEDEREIAEQLKKVKEANYRHFTGHKAHHS